MSSVCQRLGRKLLIAPPKWLSNAVQFEVLHGSEAYGVSSDDSDRDIYGFAVPPRDIVFPHLRGEILGFGKPTKRFDQFQAHHVECDGRTYDLTFYNVVKFFDLCMGCNPNMIDALFVPRRCVLYTTAIGELVRENRRMFLHRGAWFKFKGYAYSQYSRLEGKNSTGKRKELIEKYSYDIKFAYHCVRLMCEVEQILTEGDLDLERNREQLKSIRAGEWSLALVKEYFHDKERQLEEAYAKSELPNKPDEEAIKQLLLDCLTHHYGTLEGAIVNPGGAERALRGIERIITEGGWR